MENKEKITVTVSQLQNELAILMSKVVIALIPIFLYSIIQLIRIGNQSDYLLLLIGCILSVAAIMGYFINELTNGIKKKKSFLAMFLTFGGLIPWAFGSYVVFVDGFWSLKELFNGFSIIIIVKAFIFVFLGYVVVSNFYKVTEIGRHVSSGLFIVEEK